jgi:hypothetical protein
VRAQELTLLKSLTVRLIGLKSASPKSETNGLAARLKPCPDTKLAFREFSAAEADFVGRRREHARRRGLSKQDTYT